MSAADWLALAATAVGGGSGAAVVVKIHRLALAAERVAAVVERGAAAVAKDTAT
jgi:hypothetical protein